MVAAGFHVINVEGNPHTVLVPQAENTNSPSKSHWNGSWQLSVDALPQAVSGWMADPRLKLQLLHRVLLLLLAVSVSG